MRRLCETGRDHLIRHGVGFWPLALSCAVFLVGTAGVLAGEANALLEQCAACHGPDGIARSADVPNLAGQHELYLYNQLKAFAAGKRTHREMRFMSRQLTDADMREIAQHYERLPR